MTLVDRVRKALEGYRPVREIEMPGGLIFEWDGDPLAGVGNGELRVRAADGWTTVTGDLDDLDDVLGRAAEIVVAECVVRWHSQLRAGGFDAFRAMLGLVHHDLERVQLQRILLSATHGSDRALAQLAVTCLGHVGRIDGAVLPEVVPRLRELLSDPQLGGTAEDALGDIGVSG